MTRRLAGRLELKPTDTTVAVRLIQSEDNLPSGRVDHHGTVRLHQCFEALTVLRLKRASVADAFGKRCEFGRTTYSARSTYRLRIWPVRRLFR